MTPTIDGSGLRRTSLGEWALRFLFGGAITAAAGLVSHEWGPVVGGLFLAFPAILPATLTLVDHHDGAAEATDDARGAVLGTIGLAAFALVVWRGAARLPIAVTLTVATVAWALTGVAMWAACYGRR